MFMCWQDITYYIEHERNLFHHYATTKYEMYEVNDFFRTKET